MNNDGRADLVFGRSGTGNLVFINTSGTKGEFFMASKLGAAVTSSVLLGDFDLDRDNDVFVVNGNGDQIYTNVGNSSGTFVLHPRQLTNADARMAAAGRFSIDDRVDVAVIAGGGAAVFFNDGAANFGQGDMAGPTVQLRGEPTVTLTVGDTYADAGATASDAADGDVSSRITVKNPVNTAVIGTYTVTYDATDLSGNSAAPPATRSCPRPGARERGRRRRRRARCRVPADVARGRVRRGVALWRVSSAPLRATRSRVIVRFTLGIHRAALLSALCIESISCAIVVPISRAEPAE